MYSFRNCYHGTSPYTQGLTGMGTWKYPFANGFGVHHVSHARVVVAGGNKGCDDISPQAMCPDVYRGLWGGTRDSLSQTPRASDSTACDMYVNQLKDTITFSVPKGKLAAFFAEPIQVS